MSARQTAIKEAGFSLIELLVVIAVVGLLASVITVAIGNARANSRDTKKRADLRQVHSALQLYYQKNGTLPGNFNCNGTFCPGGNGTNASCDDGSSGATGDWDAVAQVLIDDGLLNQIPTSPGGASYCYYYYRTQNPPFAILATELDTGELSTAGIPPSRRYSWPAPNWCDAAIPSRWYCLEVRAR